MSDCLDPSEIECYVRGELHAASAERVEAHLAGCSKCTAHVEEARRNEEFLGSVLRGQTARTAPHVPPARSVKISGYEILDEIHRGGQGVVIEALQRSTKRKVAIKVIIQGPLASGSALKRFEREIELIAQLKHPNIISIFDSGETAEGRRYYVMDYVRGRRLNDYVRERSLTLEQTLELFSKVCEAIQYAHQQGIIHRDLKPSNVIVDADGSPKVLDFGLAKLVSAPVETEISLTEAVLGTLPYMSPEQTRGNPDEIDTRTDVYSLSVMLYELLTGSYPYQVSGQMAEVLKNITETPPSPPSSVWTKDAGVTRRTTRRLRAGQCPIDDEVETIVLRGLAKDRDRRYQSVGELSRDLQHYLAGEPIEAKRDSGWYVLKKTMGRYRVPVSIAAVFVLLITGGLITSISLWQQAERRQRETIQVRDQLKTVVDFQSSMLGAIDVAGMALAIVDGFENRIRAVLAARIENQGELDQVMYEWRQRTLTAGPTTVAQSVLDEFVLAKVAETIEKKFADQPLVRATLQQTVASTYAELGLYESAMPLQEAALQTRREELGDDHQNTLMSIGNMGELLQLMGKYEDAELFFREALQGCRRVLADDDPDTLTLIAAMGLLLTENGHYEDAERYAREALEARRRVLGNDHQDTLTSIHNMGYLLMSMGNLADAEPYYREALTGYRRVLGDDHPETLGSINNMAALLQTMERLAEAIPLWDESLEGYRRVLGDEHPDTLLSINNIGYHLQLMGKLDEAEKFYREALQGFRRVLGDEHPRTLLSINNMGFLLEAMGKLAEAEPYYREALQGRRRVLPDDHRDTLLSINNMGYLQRELGRLEQAEALGAEAVRGAKRSLPDGDLYTGVFLTNYGTCLAELKRYAHAETALLEAHGILKTAAGPEHERTIKVIQSLADLYGAWHEVEPGQGYDAKAAEWRAKLPEYRGRVWSPSKGLAVCCRVNVT